MGEKTEKNTKNNEGEKKNDGGASTIVLQFDMHCEGCAKKVRKSLMKFQGVESVKTDCSTNKLVLTGKVDPVKVKERVEEKIKKTVELVSLQPNKATKEGGNGKGGGGSDGDKKKSEDKKPEEKKSDAKSDDKKKSEEKVKEKPKEPTVATVQLKTKVHCEGCAQKIKKIVGRCEGVQDVNVDLAKDLITAKGTMNMKDLLPYLNIKLKRSVELAPTKNGDSAGADKKPKEGGGKSENPKEGGDKSEKPKKSSDEKKDSSADKKTDAGEKKDCDCDKKDVGGEKKKGASGEGAGPSKGNGPKIEVNKMEYNPYGYDQAYSYAYDPRQQGDGYGHQVVEYWHAPEYSQPPQLFSDENPNACSVM